MDCFQECMMNHCAVPKTWTMQCWLLGMILTMKDKNTGLSKTGRNIYISVNRLNSQCLWLKYCRCGVKHHIIIQSINQFHIIIEILCVLPQCCINCMVLLSSRIKKSNEARIWTVVHFNQRWVFQSKEAAVSSVFSSKIHKISNIIFYSCTMKTTLKLTSF